MECSTIGIMKPFFYVFLILFSVSLVSCEKHPIPSDIPHQEDPYKPEIYLPKSIQISGKYTLTKENKNFQFDSEEEDWYCYYSLIEDNRHSDEDIIPLRFRLYDENNRLIHERPGFTNNVGRKYITTFQKSSIEEEGFTEKVTVWSYIPYHEEAVKIKAFLVDDRGKNLRILDEREILLPEEFRKRKFYEGCYREVGFHR